MVLEQKEKKDGVEVTSTMVRPEQGRDGVDDVKVQGLGDRLRAQGWTQVDAKTWSQNFREAECMVDIKESGFRRRTTRDMDTGAAMLLQVNSRWCKKEVICTC